MKVLGIAWNNADDKLEFDLSKWSSDLTEAKVTKRFILSQIAKLFDPLGIVSPITVLAKALFRELCVEKLNWDDELPEERKDQWNKWVSDFKNIDKISVP